MNNLIADFNPFYRKPFHNNNLLLQLELFICFVSVCAFIANSAPTRLIAFTKTV